MLVSFLAGMSFAFFSIFSAACPNLAIMPDRSRAARDTRQIKRSSISVIFPVLSPVLDVSDLDEDVFSVINTVYTFHPAIDDISGEDQIADLYVNYGISVIRDMLLRAERMKKLEKQYANLESSFAAL